MSHTISQIPIARPVLDEVEVEAVRRVILSGWVTQGPEVAAFEREFAEFVGAPHACAVSNCTTALHLALLAAGAVMSWHTATTTELDWMSSFAKQRSKPQSTKQPLPPFIDA